MDADKKKAQEVLEAIKKAREKEFNLGDKEKNIKPIGTIAFSKQELALICLISLEKIERTFTDPSKDPLEAIENLAQLPFLDKISKKIAKALDIG